MTQTHAGRGILREQEFARWLTAQAQECGGWITACLDRGELLDHAGAMTRVNESAHHLESFLDDHGGRQNRAFVVFGELIAAIRGLSGVKLKLIHLRARLPRYPTTVGTSELASDLKCFCDTLNQLLLGLCSRALVESEGHRMSWVPCTAALPEPPHRPLKLPRNLDVEVHSDQEKQIAEIGGRMVHVLQASRSLDLARKRTRDEITGYVLKSAREERCRWYESAVHNVQSMYDTHVANTALEEAHPWLGALRGHASISYHLLEMATDLVHFYERRESDLGHKPASEAISAVVPKEAILDLAVNTCLRHAYLFVESSAAVVDRIFDTFVPAREERLELPEGVTLHARPLALIVQIARRYSRPTELSIEGERCSATSLMALIMLAGKHADARTVVVRGDVRALADLGALVRCGLGELGTAFPAELAYLKLTHG